MQLRSELSAICQSVRSVHTPSGRRRPAVLLSLPVRSVHTPSGQLRPAVLLSLPVRSFRTPSGQRRPADLLSPSTKFTPQADNDGPPSSFPSLSAQFTPRADNDGPSSCCPSLSAQFTSRADNDGPRFCLSLQRETMLRHYFSTQSARKANSALFYLLAYTAVTQTLNLTATSIGFPGCPRSKEPSGDCPSKTPGTGAF